MGREGGGGPRAYPEHRDDGMSGKRCYGTCVLNSLENTVAAALSLTPWYKASIGLGSMKPSVWAVLQENYPQQFANVHWSSLIDNGSLDIEAIAYYLSYLKQDAIPFVAPGISRRYSEDQILEGMYNLGTQGFDDYVQGNSSARNPWGQEINYINTVGELMPVAQAAICAWSSYCTTRIV